MRRALAGVALSQTDTRSLTESLKADPLLLRVVEMSPEKVHLSSPNALQSRVHVCIAVAAIGRGESANRGRSAVQSHSNEGDINVSWLSE
jgi:hypothetical protein